MCEPALADQVLFNFLTQPAERNAEPGSDTIALNVSAIASRERVKIPTRLYLQESGRTIVTATHIRVGEKHVRQRATTLIFS